jgi:hypothetical protein
MKIYVLMIEERSLVTISWSDEPSPAGLAAPELLRELVPDHALTAILHDINNPSTAEHSAAVTAAAEKIGQDVRVFKTSGVMKPLECSQRW